MFHREVSAVADMGDGRSTRVVGVTERVRVRLGVRDALHRAASRRSGAAMS